MPQRTVLTRRAFLETTTSAAAVLSMSAYSYARILGAGARLNVAYVGVGGIAGGQHIGPLAGLGADCTAYCDADTDRWGNCAERWPQAKGYTDYRAMFDAHEKEIDAVMVGTPDHQHYPATIQAMMRGKHVYTQKPLTHTVWEARQLGIAQRKTKLATQMGNQGHASDSLRATIDYLRGGAIGDLVEAHVWSNRPWWRQGEGIPDGGEPVPDRLDWDSWIGPARMRPFRHEPADNWGGLYHPFNWRGFWDFGCGALGDMACHELDPLYWALEPGFPTEVELVAGAAFAGAPRYAKNSTVRFRFSARGERPAFDVFWHDGGNRPDRPEELAEGKEMTSEGALYIGTEAKMIALGQARNVPELLPGSLHEEYGTPEQQIERSVDGHHKEWYLACTGEKPFDFPKCNFSYAAPFTEMILLGCIAQRVGGKLAYDPEKMTFEGRDDATALVTKEYREGWDFRM
ncbi:MAG: Gfo/Idh/MocA family oxidoreductase [Planctomycetota bacterium]|jgi:predicted dehydrogenase|nr:Gfo/Idh/MocA family oxidoreductase [Planctomycetota bacterium]